MAKGIGVRLDNQGDIPLLFDGHPSLQARDKAISQAQKEKRKREKSAVEKLCHGLQLEQENVDAMVKFTEDLNDIHEITVGFLIGELRRCIDIIEVQVQDLAGDDHQYIEDLKKNIDKVVNPDGMG